MASLALQCPVCRNKFSTKRKRCKCGLDLDMAKRDKKVKYYLIRPDTENPKKQVWRGIDKFNDSDGKPFDAYNPKHAQLVFAQYMSSEKQGNVQIFEPRPEKDWTFQELTDWFIGEVLPGRIIRKELKHPKVIKAKLEAFNTAFGEVKVVNIERLHLENYQASLKQEGLAPATIDNRIGAAKDAINQGFLNNKVDAKPYKAFSGVKNLLEAGANARSETMSIEQYLNFLDTCRPRVRPLVEVAMNTGMRAGEIRAIRWSFIGKDFIKIPLELTKTNNPNTKERGVKVIPISNNVRKVLNQQREMMLKQGYRNDLVFQLRGQEIRNSTFSREFMEDCVKAGMPAGRKMEGGITFHDIRSTVKTNMANAGVDPTFRDALLGHSRKGMDTYYIQIDPKDLTSHMATYERWLNSEIRQTLDRGAKSSV